MKSPDRHGIPDRDPPSAARSTASVTVIVRVLMSLVGSIGVMLCVFYNSDRNRARSSVPSSSDGVISRAMRQFWDLPHTGVAAFRSS
jgi:hypothetical protein